MLRSLKIFLASIMIGLLPAESFAGPVIIKDLKRSKSAWFYNKPGATVESVARDKYNCTAFGHHMFTMSPFKDGDPFIEHSGIGGSLIGGAVSSGPIRGNTDDCMMSLGYRRFTTRDSTLKDFEKRFNGLSYDEKNKYFGDTTPPEGKLTRQWVNTFWLYEDGEEGPSVEDRSYLPTRFDMSKSQKLSSIRPTFKDNPSVMMQSGATPLKTLPIDTSDANTSIVVVKIKPVSGKAAQVGFSRIDPITGEPNPIIGKKGKAKIPTLTLSHKTDQIGEFTVYEIPAGHYALSFGRFHAMCMKTVIFEAKGGDVTYLGDYTGLRNKEPVHPLAPTPRMRFRFDQGNPSEVETALNLGKPPLIATFKNNFEMQCPAMLAEKMYGVSFPGKADFKSP